MTAYKLELQFIPYEIYAQAGFHEKLFDGSMTVFF